VSRNAIARTDDTKTSLEVLPPARPAMSTARQVLMEHAEMANMAYDFATKLVCTKLVPVRYRSQPEEATAAILYGAELGMGPIAALQNIFDVHGSPGIYARTAQALLEVKGFQFKTLESSNTVGTVAGWKPGRDPDVHEPDEVSTFTIEDAERAGWCPKPQDGDRGGVLINGVRYQANANGKLAGNEKYLTQPRQMLWAKPMMEVCRHLSPATLLGIAYSVEELESEPATEIPAPAGRAAATDALTVEEILEATPDNPAAEKPKGQTSRVEAALAKARAANEAQERDQEDDDDTTRPADGAQAAPEPGEWVINDPGLADAREAAIAQAKARRAQARADEGKPPAGDPISGEPEPSPDPSETEPTGDDQPPAPLDMGDDLSDAADEQASASAESETARDDRPATKEQLQELTQLIAAAGFQPTDKGRAEWFAFVSQTVGRDVTANNQLTRDEIGRVSEELRDSQP